MKTTDRLKHIREALQLSAPEFAARLGYFNAGSYRNIENGADEITEKLLARLQKSVPTLNMEWFKTGEGEMFNEEITNSNFIKTQTIETMTLETLNRMLSIIEKQQEDIHIANLNVKQAQENQSHLIRLIPGGQVLGKQSGAAV